MSLATFRFRSTRYIKHLAESANFKGGTFNKHRNGLIGNRFEMPNVSYTHPLWCSVWGLSFVCELVL